MVEFVSWANRTLAVQESSALSVFRSLDLCDRGTLGVWQLSMLSRAPDVVVFCALLLSRYGLDWRVFAAADANEDGSLTEQEFVDFFAKLTLPPEVSLEFFRLLNFRHEGRLVQTDIKCVASNDRLVFDFRRLAILASPIGTETFSIADLDADELISRQELEKYACDQLAIPGSPALDQSSSLSTSSASALFLSRDSRS